MASAPFATGKLWWSEGGGETEEWTRGSGCSEESGSKVTPKIGNAFSEVSYGSKYPGWSNDRSRCGVADLGRDELAPQHGQTKCHRADRSARSNIATGPPK